MPSIRAIRVRLVVALSAGSFAVTADAGNGPPPNAILRLRADQGLDRGFSDLVTSWEGEESTNLTLVQNRLLSLPQYQRVGVGNRPALHFDGNDFLESPYTPLSSDYTKVVVLSLDDYGMPNHALGGSGGGASLQFAGTDQVRISHGSESLISPLSTPLHRKTILVATYSSALGWAQLYQDGALVVEGSLVSATDSSIYLGGDAGIGSFHGSIAEVLVYDRVLTEQEIAKFHIYLTRRYAVELESQVQVQTFPAPFALVPRQRPDDLAYVPVAGSVTDANWVSARLIVERDGEPWTEQELDLVFDPDSGTAPFHLQSILSAGLFEYSFRLLLVDDEGRTRLAAKAERITCGDAFLVMGQSNANAYDFHSEDLANQYQNTWIRSFGADVESSEVAFDLHWDIADGEAKKTHASVGCWPLKVAHELVQAHGIPIALINGALEGTEILLHQRNDTNPGDLTTLYGRLWFRAQLSGIAPDVRAMLWYQGEADFENRITYAPRFRSLLADWKEDYGRLEAVFTFQLRKGCGVFVDGVREVQRLMPDTQPLVRVMSTTKVTGHDGCHYYFAGYDELGLRLFRQIDRDLYDGTDVIDIDPPNLQTARWLDAQHDRILLTFRDPLGSLVWEQGTELYLKLDDGTAVLSGTVLGTTITLQLENSSTATKIRYDDHQFDGPTIHNLRGVGALTFHEVRIADPS